MSLQPGDQIDIWVVEKALGAGGMGSVYRCHNRAANRILAAVKVLEGSLRQYQEAEARFIREAEILFQLDHPNIVKVRNVRTDMDPPYLEMEFVEGESLEARLNRGPMAFEEAIDLMEQIASALAYLHGKGVCHRDIKPANLVVRSDGTCKLVDFGLAVEADVSRITQQGVTFGTVSYAPPEWIAPDRLEPAAWDSYAIGVVFYEMLTGQMAFPVTGHGSARQQAMQVIVAKQNHPPLDPGPRFSDEVRLLIREMTHSDIDQRLVDSKLAWHRLQRIIGRIRPDEDTVSASESGFEESADSVVIEAPHPGMPPGQRTRTWDSQTGAPSRVRTPTTPAVPTLLIDDDHLDETPSALSRRSSMGCLMAGSALAAATLMAGFVGIGAVGYLNATTPTSRDLDVVVAALTTGTPVEVALEGERPQRTDGFVNRFGAVPFTEAEVSWAIGAGCSVAACPGEQCPTWCGSGRATRTIPEGTDPYTWSLEIEPAQIATVRVVLPRIDGEPSGRFELGGVSGEAGPGELRFEVLPGQHELAVDLGDCPEDAMGCWPDGECPEGCTSVRRPFVVPWLPSEPVVQELGLTAPTAAVGTPRPTPAPSPRPDPTPAPGPAPAPAPTSAGSAAPAAVTNAEFAAWLATHPSFHPQAAIEAKRAAEGYLGGWSGLQPPAGQGNFAVVNVSYYAAAQYCRNHGGIAHVDAQPHTWPETASQPGMEIRTDGIRGMWRQSDGQTSDALGLRQVIPIMGFRCAQ